MSEQGQEPRIYVFDYYIFLSTRAVIRSQACLSRGPTLRAMPLYHHSILLSDTSEFPLHFVSSLDKSTGLKVAMCRYPGHTAGGYGKSQIWVEAYSTAKITLFFLYCTGYLYVEIPEDTRVHQLFQCH